MPPGGRPVAVRACAYAASAVRVQRVPQAESQSFASNVCAQPATFAGMAPSAAARAWEGRRQRVRARQRAGREVCGA